MSSGVNWNNDARWEYAAAEREAGDRAASEGRDHYANAIDAIGDFHGGSFCREFVASRECHGEAMEHYTAANTAENEVLQDACSSGGGCTIL